MRLLCLFFHCQWFHVLNVSDTKYLAGLYQCRHCKRVSIGSPRNIEDLDLE